MTEPEVGRLTFKNVIGHEPSRRELARVMSRRLHRLPQTVAESKDFRVLPGVVETLDRLGADGYLLGITTGGMEAAAYIKLARAHLNHYFCFGGYGSDSTDRTELTLRALERAGMLLGKRVDPKEALVVGDTSHDIDAAHHAGAFAVGVATGHFTKDELRDAGADYVLGSLEEELPLDAGMLEAT
jgi:phosphoglycolate phosphatase-like HAD superfamily hydrolase